RRQSGRGRGQAPGNGGRSGGGEGGREPGGDAGVTAGGDLRRIAGTGSTPSRRARAGHGGSGSGDRAQRARSFPGSPPPAVDAEPEQVLLRTSQARSVPRSALPLAPALTPARRSRPSQRGLTAPAGFLRI